MLTIGNLKLYEELKSAGMEAVRGGFDPFAFSGLSSMMGDLQRRWPTEPVNEEPAPVPLAGGGSDIVVKEYHYTSITSES